MRQYIEDDVEAAIHWYYAKKAWKAWASQLLKFLTLLATGMGGLLPIVSATGIFSSSLPEAQRQVRNLQVNQIGYLCFGLAAAFLAFDKYFGYSTGWMRYITTAMALETALRNFRLDWARTTSGLAGATPSGAVLEALLQKIQDFCVAARTLVEKETQAWVMEFQTNLSQLEKEAKAAMDSARTAVETAQKDAKSAAGSTRPGAIDLSVENVLDTDHGYDVTVDGELRKSAVTSKSCAIMSVAAGLHELAVTAMMSGSPAHASQVVDVAPGTAEKLSITLTKAKGVVAG
jgi:SMODS and SLOG-associating 2TM effector domain 2